MNASARSLLAYLGLNGPTHRSELAEATRLSKAAVSTLARNLLEAGLIHEVATARSTSGQGRPPVLLDVEPRYGFLVGVRLDDDPLISVLTDLKGGLLGQEARALSERPEPDEVAAGIADSVRALLARARVDPGRLLGVGVAVSGIVDAAAGIVRHSAILGWDDVPLADAVGERVGAPVLVENDANSVATYEHLYGSARGTDDFALVTVGRGVGGAQFVAGRLQRGHDGGAGELAHCTIDPGGRLCACGKHGCLDTIAARGAIFRAARERGLRAESMTALEALAQRGDPHALAALREAAAALGLAVSHLIHLTDPGLVLIAGSEIHPNTVFATAARQAVERNVLPRRLTTLNLAFRPLEPISWAQGAAALATHSLLTGRLALPPDGYSARAGSRAPLA